MINKFSNSLKSNLLYNKSKSLNIKLYNLIIKHNKLYNKQKRVDFKMVCEDCEKLKEKVKKMFDFFHDALLDIADQQSEKWYDEFTKEFDKTWSDN